VDPAEHACCRSCCHAFGHGWTYTHARYHAKHPDWSVLEEHEAEGWELVGMGRPERPDGPSQRGDGWDSFLYFRRRECWPARCCSG